VSGGFVALGQAGPIKHLNLLADQLAIRARIVNVKNSSAFIGPGSRKGTPMRKLPASFFRPSPY
jgi:hypothetical protein